MTTTLVVAAHAILAGLGLAVRRPAGNLARLAVAGSAVSVAGAGWLAAGSFRGATVVGEWSPGLLVSIGWRLETIALAIAMLVAGIGALVLQYAGAYFGDSRSARTTIALLALFETAMLGPVTDEHSAGWSPISGAPRLAAALARVER